MAAVAAGADGLLFEMQADPGNALCDGAQSITPDTFDALMRQIRAYCALENKVCE